MRKLIWKIVSYEHANEVMINPMEVKKASGIMSTGHFIIQIVTHKKIIATIENNVRMIIPLPIMRGALVSSLIISRAKIGLINKLSVEPIKKKKMPKKEILPNPLWPKYLAKEESIKRLMRVSKQWLTIITPLFFIIFFAVSIMARYFKSFEFADDISKKRALCVTNNFDEF
jgi:hypothetical protein